MSQAIICSQAVAQATKTCWTVAVESQHVGFVSASLALLDKLMPALLSAGVALLVVGLNRRRELRKVSLDVYREFYSEDVADNRYKAEKFFERYADQDWGPVDPYDLPDPEGDRAGYAAVTRYWARVSILFQERELNRKLTAKLMARMAGYWWGLVYEHMTQRETMYTRDLIIFLAGRFNRGATSDEFQKGYDSGVRRRARSADGLRHSREIEATMRAGRVGWTLDDAGELRRGGQPPAT